MSDSPCRHVFSVDLEEYFQVQVFERTVPRPLWEQMPSRVEASVDQLLELLDRHSALATFFTVGWLAERKPGLVRRIVSLGHEIASHSWWHRRVTTLTPTEFREDVRRCRAPGGATKAARMAAASCSARCFGVSDPDCPVNPVCGLADPAGGCVDLARLAGCVVPQLAIPRAAITIMIPAPSSRPRSRVMPF